MKIVEEMTWEAQCGETYDRATVLLTQNIECPDLMKKKLSRSERRGIAMSSGALRASKDAVLAELESPRNNVRLEVPSNRQRYLQGQVDQNLALY